MSYYVRYAPSYVECSDDIYLKSGLHTSLWNICMDFDATCSGQSLQISPEGRFEKETIKLCRSVGAELETEVRPRISKSKTTHLSIPLTSLTKTEDIFKARA